jgi:hypothetical protein
MPLLNGNKTDENTGLGKLQRFSNKLNELKSAQRDGSIGTHSYLLLDKLITFINELLQHNDLSYWNNLEAKKRIETFLDDFSHSTFVPACWDTLSSETAQLYVNFLEALKISDDVPAYARFLLSKTGVAKLQENCRYVINSTKERLQLFSYLAKSSSNNSALIKLNNDVSASANEAAEALRKIAQAGSSSDVSSRNAQKLAILQTYYLHIDPLVQQFLSDTRPPFTLIGVTELTFLAEVNYKQVEISSLKIDTLQTLISKERNLLYDAGIHEIPTHPKGFLGLAKQLFSPEKYRKKMTALYDKKCTIIEGLTAYLNQQGGASMALHFTVGQPGERKRALAKKLIVSLNACLLNREGLFYPDHLVAVLGAVFAAHQENLLLINAGDSFGRLGSLLSTFREELLVLFKDLDDSCLSQPFSSSVPREKRGSENLPRYNELTTRSERASSIFIQDTAPDGAAMACP